MHQDMLFVSKIMPMSMNDTLSFSLEDVRITMGTVGKKEPKEIETMMNIATYRKTPPLRGTTDAKNFKWKIPPEWTGSNSIRGS